MFENDQAPHCTGHVYRPRASIHACNCILPAHSIKSKLSNTQKDSDGNVIFTTEYLRKKKHQQLAAETPFSSTDLFVINSLKGVLLVSPTTWPNETGTLKGKMQEHFNASLSVPMGKLSP